MLINISLLIPSVEPNHKTYIETGSMLATFLELMEVRY